MLATIPNLGIRRPSPTTAEFTVTTQRPLHRAVGYILLITRIVLALLTILLLYAKLSQTPLLLSPPPSRSSYRYRYEHTHLASLLVRFAAQLPATGLVPAAMALFWLLSRKGYQSEGLLVLRGLGVQTREDSPMYFASTATRFIPTEKIQDIFVNEAFRGFEVRYYLVVVVEGEEDVVVVFPGILPGRKIVERVWRDTRACLYEGRLEEK